MGQFSIASLPGIVVTVKGGDGIHETAKSETSGDFDSQRITNTVSGDVLHVGNSEKLFWWVWV